MIKDSCIQSKLLRNIPTIPRLHLLAGYHEKEIEPDSVLGNLLEEKPRECSGGVEITLFPHL